MSEQHAGDTIPHQDEVEDVAAEVVGDELVSASDVTALTDIPSFSATYSQAELNALRTSHNKILEVLRDSGLIPSA